ncbi:MAG TPA: hypothetical protein VMA98_07030 [Candidatus Acidoferrales bacterium]|nr:hypothetical protein [Candidatus Acidoferrales bacterium]
MKQALSAFALILLVTACSQSGQSSSSSSSAPGASPAPAATNPIDFPLYAGSDVLSARDFSGKSGSESVAGQEVIAQSSASLDELESWLKQVGANPPPGYTVAASGAGADSAHAHAQALGLQFQVFTHDVSGKRHVLAVVVMDPSTFEKKAGPVLSLIDKYSMLPQSMRDPIDAQSKARTGYTVSQLLDPSQPLGAALAAAKALRSSGERGVVLVDAAQR